VSVYLTASSSAVAVIQGDLRYEVGERLLRRKTSCRKRPLCSGRNYAQMVIVGTASPLRAAVGAGEAYARRPAKSLSDDPLLVRFTPLPDDHPWSTGQILSRRTLTPPSYDVLSRARLLHCHTAAFAASCRSRNTATASFSWRP
jgi:hypothetical protein